MKTTNVEYEIAKKNETIKFELNYLEKFELIKIPSYLEGQIVNSRVKPIDYVNLKRIINDSMSEILRNKIGQLKNEFDSEVTQFLDELQCEINKLKTENTLITHAPTFNKYIKYPETIEVFQKINDVKSGDGSNNYLEIEKKLWESISVIPGNYESIHEVFIYDDCVSTGRTASICIAKLNEYTNREIKMKCFSLLWDHAVPDSSERNRTFLNSLV
jgi:hypothetical protein